MLGAVLASSNSAEAAPLGVRDRAGGGAQLGLQQVERAQRLLHLNRVRVVQLQALEGGPNVARQVGLARHHHGAARVHLSQLYRPRLFIGLG